MKEPWQVYMRIGVVHGMLFPECLGGTGPIRATLADIAHDPFFEAVDVGAIEDTQERAECAALLRDSQLAVSFACQPTQLRLQLDLNAADEQVREHAFRVLVSLFPQARELGAQRIFVMSGKNVPASDRRAAMERLVTMLRRLCREAREQTGLPLALEIFDYDVDKKALIGTCEMAAWVAREVRRDFPDFGLLHDLSHIYLCHEEPSRHFPLIREHLVAMHLGNSVSQRNHPLFGDTHPPFGVPGSDVAVPQVRDCLKALFDIGFLRPGRRPLVSFEIRTPPGTEPQTVIANMKRTLAQAWWDW
ncbi:MAG: TIM barrel protein [Gemmatales bacterium]|nr:TIM barrel protein [Gemmatales bacterium]